MFMNRKGQTLDLKGVMPIVLSVIIMAVAGIYVSSYLIQLTVSPLVAVNASWPTVYSNFTAAITTTATQFNALIPVIFGGIALLVIFIVLSVVRMSGWM